MTEQSTTNTATTNGVSSATPPLNSSSRKGKKKAWKELTEDPLKDGHLEHSASYVTGKTSVSWSSLKPGDRFSRNKSGKGLYVFADCATAYSLDTGDALVVPPQKRPMLQVWLVTAFNSVTGSTTEGGSSS